MLGTDANISKSKHTLMLCPKDAEGKYFKSTFFSIIDGNKAAPLLSSCSLEYRAKY